MTEQELRAAVAEYDAEMAREMKAFTNNGFHLLYETAFYPSWKITTHEGSDDVLIKRYDGPLTISSYEYVVEDIAQNMRAMDAAAKAFQEALK